MRDNNLYNVLLPRNIGEKMGFSGTLAELTEFYSQIELDLFGHELMKYDSLDVQSYEWLLDTTKHDYRICEGEEEPDIIQYIQEYVDNYCGGSDERD